MQPLKLIALDDKDLEIMSAHLQDAVLRVGDMAYVPSQKRFALVANRFDWESAVKSDGKPPKGGYKRRRSAVRFDRVLDAKFRDINLKAEKAVLELLAIRFEEAEAPEGYILLDFAGGGAIRLHVECIEAELRDLGAVWRTRSKPEHGEEADEAG
ncbi:MAG: DUF2948 family protein [Alphaproteobacteria bacterium]|nr:MAG: DUF2948 family protein [Alphaproteobacteria bacterium]